jgi:hypothetical protein
LRISIPHFAARGWVQATIPFVLWTTLRRLGHFISSADGGGNTDGVVSGILLVAAVENGNLLNEKAGYGERQRDGRIADPNPSPRRRRHDGNKIRDDNDADKTLIGCSPVAAIPLPLTAVTPLVLVHLELAIPVAMTLRVETAAAATFGGRRWL